MTVKAKPEEMVATPIRSITNFFGLYKDKVLPNQKNGIYGHGKERYDENGSYFLTMRKFTPVMLHGRL